MAEAAEAAQARSEAQTAEAGVSSHTDADGFASGPPTASHSKETPTDRAGDRTT
jgi:hypothetical protein